MPSPGAAVLPAAGMPSPGAAVLLQAEMPSPTARAALDSQRSMEDPPSDDEALLNLL